MGRFIVIVVLICCRNACASDDSPLADLEEALSSHDSRQVRSAETRLLSGDESVDTLLKAGALFAQHDMLADSVLVFEKCSERFPGSFEAKYNLALARIGLGDYLSAAKTLDAIGPASSRESAAVEYLHGKIYAATGRQQQARQSLENAYRRNPREENYALDLALVYIRSSSYVLAIKILEPAHAQHPESEELALELALSKVLSGQPTDAISLCRQLIQQDPAQSIARVIAAFSQCLGENYVTCESEASVGLSLAHPNSYLYYLHAEALWNTGSSDRSRMLSDLGTALAGIPACSVCLLLRSKVLEAGHDDRAAVADLKTALAHDAQLAPAWYLLSALYRKAGQSAEAADAIRRYRALHDTQANEEVETFRRQFLDNLDSKSNQ